MPTHIDSNIDTAKGGEEPPALISNYVSNDESSNDESVN